MQELLKSGRVTRGWIGVEPQEMSEELAATFKLPSAGEAALRGVVITGVLHNGPAAQAGIRPGDVITQVNQQPVRNVSELLSRVANLAPGQAATLQVWRRTGLAQLTVTPGQRPSPTAALKR
jgi:S1-C subfamily serine protease